ncbi:hypothetical protein KSP40_PGU003924 [Platanthera guangdongensis]|uniref:Uncharacterized protein n=1 Tax=Platanthera guangdongensis TaxID=2320717 RepID=A0ABR2M8D3_9ASPA
MRGLPERRKVVALGIEGLRWREEEEVMGEEEEVGPASHQEEERMAASHRLTAEFRISSPNSRCHPWVHISADHCRVDNRATKILSGVQRDAFFKQGSSEIRLNLPAATAIAVSLAPVTAAPAAVSQDPLVGEEKVEEVSGICGEEVGPGKGRTRIIGLEGSGRDGGRSGEN